MLWRTIESLFRKVASRQVPVIVFHTILFTCQSSLFRSCRSMFKIGTGNNEQYTTNSVTYFRHWYVKHDFLWCCCSFFSHHIFRKLFTIYNAKKLPAKCLKNVIFGRFHYTATLSWRLHKMQILEKIKNTKHKPISSIYKQWINFLCFETSLTHCSDVILLLFRRSVILNPQIFPTSITWKQKNLADDFTMIGVHSFNFKLLF